MSSAQHTAAVLRGWRRPWVPAGLRRRLLAAVLAAGAVVLALSSRHPAPQAARSPAAATPSAGLLTGLRPGQVAAPLRLVDPGVAALLHRGESVDVLAAPDSADGSADASQALARVVARDVKVLAVAAPSSGDQSSGTLVVLAVSRADAQALAGAEAGGRLSVTLQAG